MDRAELRAEWILALADQAVALPNAQRGPAWDALQQRSDEYFADRDDAEGPYAVLVLYQTAIAHAARGTLERQEWEWTSPPDEIEVPAPVWETLVLAYDELSTIEEHVTDRLRQRGVPGGGAPEGDFTIDQLVSLRRFVQWRMGRVLMDQGLCFPERSDDRQLLIGQAREPLEGLAGLEIDSPLIWQARVDTLTCFRLLGLREDMQRVLNGLAVEQKSAEFVLKLLAEQILFDLDRGDSVAAIRNTFRDRDRDREAVGRPVPEYDLACLQAVLNVCAKLSNDPHFQLPVEMFSPIAASDIPQRQIDAAVLNSLDFWQAEALRRTILLDEECGPYWARRGEMLIGQNEQASGANVAVHIIVAERALDSQQFDEALAGYDRARIAAATAGDDTLALRLGSLAASIERSRDRDLEAMNRFREVALAFPDEELAHESHYWAIDHAGRIAAEERTEAALDQFEELMTDHVLRWPNRPASDEVRWRLGRLKEVQGDPTSAASIYFDINPEFSEFEQVIAALVRCCRMMIEEAEDVAQTAASLPPTGSQDGNASAIALDAARGFESFLPSLGGTGSVWTRSQILAATASSEFYFLTTSDGYLHANRVLQRLISEAGTPPLDLAPRIRGLLVVAQAGSGDPAIAFATMNAFLTGPISELLSVLVEIDRLVSNAPSQQRTPLLSLQDRILQKLKIRIGELDATQINTAAWYEARWFAASRRISEAVAAYRALLNTSPANAPEIRLEYARLLSSQNSADLITEALAQWRGIESGSPEKSHLWFEAKYEIARAHFRLGNTDQAARMVGLLRVLYPEMGGTELKQQFDELERRCED